MIFHLNFTPSLSAMKASISHCTAGPTQQLFLTYLYFSSSDTENKIAPKLILRQAPYCYCSSNRYHSATSPDGEEKTVSICSKDVTEAFQQVSCSHKHLQFASM